MGDAHLDWWMDADGRWHEGDPPPTWWRARDGRWHPPSDADTAEETDVVSWVGSRREPLEAASLVPWVGRQDTAEETSVVPWVGRRDQAEVARHSGGIRRAAPLALVLLGAAVAVAAVVTSGDGLGGEDTDTAGTRTTVSQSVPSRASLDATPDAEPGDAPPTTAAPADSEPSVTTAPPTTPSTVPPTTTPAPPTTSPTDPAPTLRARCEPEGATAVSPTDGPLVCTVEKCQGGRFSEPRWRQATCWDGGSEPNRS
jgi:hypothetical protein